MNGVGKIGVLVALAQEFLTQTAPFVFLSVDRLAGVAKLADLKGELGLTQDLLYVLEAWLGGEPGVIIIDALDASRGGPSEAAFASLIELALPRLGERWSIVASTVLEVDIDVNIVRVIDEMLSLQDWRRGGRPSSRSAAIESSGACVPPFFPATAAYPARRSGSHHTRRSRRH